MVETHGSLIEKLEMFLFIEDVIGILGWFKNVKIKCLMGSFFVSYKIHKFFFLFLIFVTILDPGNNILNMKEIFFMLTFLFGLFEFKKFSNNSILLASIFISIIFPLIWCFFGYIFNYYFDFGYAIMYLKAFIFFSLINVCLDPRIDFSKLFCLSTLLIIPITIALYFFIGDFELADVAFRSYESTFMVSKRAFGGFVFDPVVFYKTSPLLIFGFSYLCSKNRFKYLGVNLILIFLCVLTMTISGTRANMMSSFIIVFIYIYINYFSIAKAKKIVFWILSSFLFVLFLIPFLATYAFDKSEQSNETKLSLISDYLMFWNDNILSIFLGQGLGGGFITAERGLSYMAEPTYFEILRIFGIVGGGVILVFICIPLYLFMISKSSILYDRYHYMFIGYLCYIIVEVPSNPLLLASTGMIVMVVVYSVSINVYFAKKRGDNIIKIQ